jgi:hypothetical protein
MDDSDWIVPGVEKRFIIFTLFDGGRLSIYLYPSIFSYHPSNPCIWTFNQILALTLPRAYTELAGDRAKQFPALSTDFNGLNLCPSQTNETFFVFSLRYAKCNESNERRFVRLRRTQVNGDCKTLLRIRVKL